MKNLLRATLASCAIVALITAILVNAPQYRVNFNESGITLTK